MRSSQLIIVMLHCLALIVYIYENFIISSPLSLFAGLDAIDSILVLFNAHLQILAHKLKYKWHQSLHLLNIFTLLSNQARNLPTKQFPLTTLDFPYGFIISS